MIKNIELMTDFHLAIVSVIHALALRKHRSINKWTENGENISIHSEPFPQHKHT